MFFIDTPVALIGAMFFSGWLTTVFSAILVLALILEVANDKYVLGYVSLFAYAVVVSIFTDLKPFVYIWNNPLEFIGFLLCYFAIGGVYSLAKYRNWLKHVTLKIRDLKIAFIEAYDLTIRVTDDIPAELTKDWKNHLYYKLPSDDYSRIKGGFGPGYQKELILNWIAFWPFSAVGLFIADPLEKAVNWIYDELVDVYRNMYTKIINKYINVSDIEKLK